MQADVAEDRQSDVPTEETAQPGGFARKKLYDQNLSDWSARYKKNKQSLDVLVKDCKILRQDAQKAQREVDERAESLRQLEENYENNVFVKFLDVKASYEAALQQKSMLQAQVSENRKQKTQLTQERKLLKTDSDRKNAELSRMAEVHDKLEGQLFNLTQQLGQLTSDRRRMERELDEVQHNLRANTELADEVTNEISHFQGGIKDSVDLHMAPAERMQSSVGQNSATGFVECGQSVSSTRTSPDVAHFP